MHLWENSWISEIIRVDYWHYPFFCRLVKYTDSTRVYRLVLIACWFLRCKSQHLLHLKMLILSQKYILLTVYSTKINTGMPTYTMISYIASLYSTNQVWIARGAPTLENTASKWFWTNPSFRSHLHLDIVIFIIMSLLFSWQQHGVVLRLKCNCYSRDGHHWVSIDRTPTISNKELLYVEHLTVWITS